MSEPKITVVRFQAAERGRSRDGKLYAVVTINGELHAFSEALIMQMMFAIEIEKNGGSAYSLRQD